MKTLAGRSIFDDIWTELNTFNFASDGKPKPFPKYNIVKINDEEFVIELATAGYSQEEISVKILEGKLVISAEKSEDNRIFLHKGLTNKRFEERFKLSPGVRVKHASYENGILSVFLKYYKEKEDVINIPINSTTTSKFLTEGEK